MCDSNFFQDNLRSFILPAQSYFWPVFESYIQTFWLKEGIQESHPPVSSPLLSPREPIHLQTLWLKPVFGLGELQQISSFLG